MNFYLSDGKAITRMRPRVWLYRLGYVCKPRSLKEGTEMSCRITDELGANGHWHAVIHIQLPLITE